MPSRARRFALVLVVTGACLAGAAGSDPPSAEAFNPIKPVCSVAGFLNGLIGKACTAVQHTGRLLSAGKKLLGGHLGSAVKTALGEHGGVVAAGATTALGLAAVVTWVLGGAKFALQETSKVLGETTTPQLETTWFSSTYWRVAGIAAMLTLPFLFAAAIQALLQSDLSLLLRAALGYLPLAMLAVSIAAPLTMLLLSASDQLSAVVSAAAGDASAQFLERASRVIGGLTLIPVSPFLACFVGLLTVAGALVLWLELLMRAAAVYVIVLMLPLAFAALVWPARRIWAARAVELLLALIVSKFAIVAVLSLGGAAMSASAIHSITGMLAGFVLLVMAAFAPWALLRLLPLAEVASGAAAPLRGEAASAKHALARADGEALRADRWTATMADMLREAQWSSGAIDAADAARAQARQSDGQNAALTGVALPTSQPPGGIAVATSQPPGGSAIAGPDTGEPAGPGTERESPSRSATSAGPSAERSPGLEPIWQMEDGEWPVLTLGLEDGWPPPPVDSDRPVTGTRPSGGGEDRVPEPPRQAPPGTTL